MITTNTEDLAKIQRKSECHQHHVPMVECMKLHHQGEEEEQKQEQSYIVLPCRHVVERPTVNRVVMTCAACGTVWTLKLNEPWRDEWTAVLGVDRR